MDRGKASRYSTDVNICWTQEQSPVVTVDPIFLCAWKFTLSRFEGVRKYTGYKIKKSWGCDIQHGDYAVYLKTAKKRVDPKSSHHKKKQIVTVKQYVLTLSHDVVHLEHMFVTAVSQFKHVWGEECGWMALRFLWSVYWLPSVLVLWWKSEDPRAVTLSSLMITQASAAVPFFCGCPWSLCCVFVCAVLDVSGSSFITLASSLKGVDPSWTLPPCNQEESPREPQAAVSSESGLGLWPLRAVCLA